MLAFEKVPASLFLTRELGAAPDAGVARSVSVFVSLQQNFTRLSLRQKDFSNTREATI